MTLFSVSMLALAPALVYRLRLDGVRALMLFRI